MSDPKKIMEMLNDHEERILRMELALKEKKKNSTDEPSDSIPENILKIIISKLDSLKILPLVILILKFYGNLSIDEQIKILKKWGKAEAERLAGGNYSRDILSSGWVHKADQSGKIAIYGLSEKGKIEAENILNKLNPNS